MSAKVIEFASYIDIAVILYSSSPKSFTIGLSPRQHPGNVTISCTVQILSSRPSVIFGFKEKFMIEHWAVIGN